MYSPTMPTQRAAMAQEKSPWVNPENLVGGKPIQVSSGLLRKNPVVQISTP
jgi:hypothetical protein